MRALLGILRDLNIVIVSRDLIDPGQEGELNVPLEVSAGAGKDWDAAAH